MSRALRASFWWAVLFVGAAGLAQGLGWVGTSVAVAGGGVAVATALVAGGLSAVAASLRAPSISPAGLAGSSSEALAFEAAAPAPTVAPAVPETVQQAERLAVLARATAGDVHFRLRPVLREIAAELLADRLAIDLDRDPRAQDALGPDLWDVVRPDRPAPSSRQAPGLTAEQLEGCVARLEGLR